MNKLCVYLSHPHITPPTEDCTAEYKKFVTKRPWYCDLGDDPAFYCCDKFNSNVTWGVCRHNVREVIDIGDEIHFVTCDKSGFDSGSAKVWNYYYVGYGVVKDKISHKDIYTNKSYFHFQHYFNMLIKPQRNGYVHWEAFDESWWHNDWKMRISNVRRKEDIEDFITESGGGAGGRYGGEGGAVCGGKDGGSYSRSIDDEFNIIYSNFPFGKNYIIFDIKKSKFNFKNKILVQQIKWYYFRKCKSAFTHKVLKNVFGDKFCFTNGSYQHPALNLKVEHSEKLQKLIT